MERTRATDAALFFLAGGLLGAGAALLLAPQSGAELRGRIDNGIREGARRSRELRVRAAYRDEKSQA